MTAAPGPARSAGAAYGPERPLRLQFAQLDALVDRIPLELGSSRLFTVDQGRIDRFAEATEDQQWIHVDPQRAAHSAFGSTIAHGFLTLALASAALEDLLQVEGAAVVVNYGLDRVRFPSPVPTGSRLQARATIVSVERVPAGYQARFRITFGREDAERPVCVADWIVRYTGLSDD